MMLKMDHIYVVSAKVTGFWPKSLHGKVLDPETRLRFLGWPDTSPRFQIVGGDLGADVIELLNVQGYLREVTEQAQVH